MTLVATANSQSAPCPAINVNRAANCFSNEASNLVRWLCAIEERRNCNRLQSYFIPLLTHGHLFLFSFPLCQSMSQSGKAWKDWMKGRERQ